MAEEKKMPPEVPHRDPTLLSPPVSHLPQPKQPINYPENKIMRFPRKKTIYILVLILSSLSILRLTKIAISTSFSPSMPSAMSSKYQTTNSDNVATLSEKEYKLLSDLIADKAPCNLLIFGLQLQFLTLSEINAGGTTTFLEDDPKKLSTIKVNSISTRVYKIDYQFQAKKAYELLKHARRSSACASSSELLHLSKCNLALKNLPQQVYKLKWDVVIVDGPSGDSPEAPGRMEAIYSASVLAREGNTTDVVVHDVDRTIEKWFSWEFLCDENLVSSKGKLWVFKIRDQLNSTRSCPAKKVTTV